MESNDRSNFIVTPDIFERDVRIRSLICHNLASASNNIKLSPMITIVTTGTVQNWR